MNCQTLERNVKAALDELGVKADVKKVSDYGEILGYGVMSTPGLVINDRLVSSGRIASVEDIKAFIEIAKA
jgi:small redox-active disulfide protein 2